MPCDSALLIYDNYDIWKVDPTGKRPASNVTKGYGRLHDITFKFINRSEDQFIQGDSTYVLLAMNNKTKDEGFYSFCLNSGEAPQLLSEGQFHYDLGYSGLKGFATLDRSTSYFVNRQSAKESPNFFVTRDFKTFEPVSAVYPEKSYNWLTSKLISWETPDHFKLFGSLYLPEDFDPKKNTR